MTSKLAWDSLKGIHQSRGPTRKISLFKQLVSIKLGDKENMSEYINRFSYAVEKLSLPKSLQSFVVAMESRDELLTMTILKVKLLQEGDRQYDQAIMGAFRRKMYRTKETKSAAIPAQFYQVTQTTNHFNFQLTLTKPTHSISKSIRKEFH